MSKSHLTTKRTFFEKWLATIKYLLPDATGEAHALADELTEVRTRMLTRPDCPEGLKMVMSRVFEELKELRPAT